MTAGLLLAGFAALGLAALIDLLGGVAYPRVRPLPYLAAALGSGCLTAAGVLAVQGDLGRIDLGQFLGFGATTLQADPLAGLFLTVSFAVAFATSVAAAGWTGARHRTPYRGLGAAYALTLGSIAVIFLSDNAFLFLFGWESLTLAFYLLSGYQRRLEGRARASFLTLGIGKTSGSFLLIGFLLLAGSSGSFLLADWVHVSGGALHSAAYLLLILGFGAKVGLVPLQVWMPSGYAAAPGPARALMAGAAVNVGFYGLWRTLELLGAPPTWLAVVLLLIAGFTAILGIAYATVQGDLARVIAYSSVENGGLILAGYGVALAGAVARIPQLIAVGLLAATLQMIAHALAKTALFLSVSAIEATTGTTLLDRLRGVGRATPWHGTAFGIGAITLAGLPPTVGFASEWFLLESFMQLFRTSGLALKLAMAVAGALVALTAGFAAVTFVRILGLTILGSPRPRSAHVRRAPEGGLLGRVGVGLAAIGCLAVAVVSPVEIGFLAHGLDPVISSRLTGAAVKSPWVLQPVFADFSILSPSWLYVTMSLLFIIVSGFTLLVTRGSVLRVRRVPAWRSATGGVTGDDRYTSFGYANPTRKVLANLLMTHAELRPVEQPSADSATADPSHASYTSDVVDVVEEYFYRPALRPLAAIVATAKRLQSGRLDAYLTYMLIALIALLAVVSALG